MRHISENGNDSPNTRMIHAGYTLLTSTLFCKYHSVVCDILLWSFDMVYSCAAYDCTTRWEKGSKITFHNFPLGKAELLEKWVLATKRKNFVPNKYTKLCNKHFTSNDFLDDVPNPKRKRLKPDAVPTIFNFPGHLQQSQPKKRRTIERRQSSNFQDEGEPTPSCQVGDHQSHSETNNKTQTISYLGSSSNLQPSTSTAQEKSHEQLPVAKNLAPKSPTKTFLRRQVRILTKRLKRRDNKIKTMKDLICTLKKKVNAPDLLIEVLENNFSGFPLQLLLNQVKNKDSSKFKHTFSTQTKEFALTLYFYSPKAYNYLRQLQLTLPNPSTLRKWISKFNCNPGFVEEVFLYLKSNVKDITHLQNVSLVFDSMSIRKQIIYDEKLGKNVGYIDLGGLKVDNHEEMATEALVFQIVSLRGNFKCMIGYFFVNKLESTCLSQIVKIAVLKLEDVGISVQSVTFDGASTNIRALKLLGCDFPEKPFFKIEGVAHEICVILDPPHMLKLSRNALSDLKVIESDSGPVSFKYIEKLNQLQNKEGLKMGNKLSDKHVFFKNRKMNVKIAAQTLSASVADALEYLNQQNHPDFANCQATVKFVRIIDQLFDFMNSRDPFGKGFKGPLKLLNKERDDSFLNEVEQYLLNLKVANQALLDHPRKTFVLGFLSNIKSITKLRDRLLKLDGFKYLLTYKLSQDHLELYFSCIRSRGGNNNNPNVKQFTWAVRKLMFRNSVRPSAHANCLELNSNYQSIDLLTSESDEDYNDDLVGIIDNVESSSFKDDILYYICGVIVRKIEKNNTCLECSSLLHTNESDLRSHTRFTDFKNKGHLVRAHGDVFKIVKYAYNIKITSTKPNIGNNALTLNVSNHFQGSVFKGHVSNDQLAGSHELLLVKAICKIFFKIISHHLAKIKTKEKSKIQSLGMRQKLTKLILFNNI